MAGIFALSVQPGVYDGDFPRDFFWETFYQQHLGEEYAGAAVYNNGAITNQSYLGLFRSNFYHQLETLKGTEAVGYCGPQQEPFFRQTKLGKIAVCFSGNVLNRSHLAEELMLSGHTFERGDDIEIIIKLLSQGKDVIDGIVRMNEKVQGSYALLVLSEQGLYAASFSGHWPLVIGEKKGALATATDPSGFKNMGFRIVRDLEPGEIVLLKNGACQTKSIIPPNQSRICSFLWVYTAFPTGSFRGIPVSLIRKRLGAALAKKDIENGFIPDLVVPVPDSGRYHAIGYYQEFCRQISQGKIKRMPLYDEVLVKYPYAGRSFTPQDEKTRKQEASIKLLESSEQYQGKIMVVCDDSIVRGTQTQTNLVPKLKDLGVIEIHFRISSIELFSYCPWGKTTRKGDLFSLKYPGMKEKIDFLGIQSIEFNTREDLLEIIGLPEETLCFDCSLED